MSFTQIKRIKEVDQTAEQAIASYGSFVDLYETTKARVRKTKRKGWSEDRILLCRAKQSIGTIHQAIADKFGQQVAFDAIEAHPFL